MVNSKNLPKPRVVVRGGVERRVGGERQRVGGERQRERVKRENIEWVVNY